MNHHHIPVVTKEQVYLRLKESGVLERWCASITEQFERRTEAADGTNGTSIRERLQREAAALLADQNIVESCIEVYDTHRGGDADDDSALRAAIVDRLREALYHGREGQQGPHIINKLKVFVYRMLHGGDVGDDSDGSGGNGGAQGESAATDLSSEIDSTVEKTMTEMQQELQKKNYQNAMERKARDIALHRKVSRWSNRATQRPTAHISASISAAQRRARLESKKRKKVITDEEDSDGVDDMLRGMRKRQKGGRGMGDASTNAPPVSEEQRRKAFEDLFGGESSSDNEGEDNVDGGGDGGANVKDGANESTPDGATEAETANTQESTEDDKDDNSKTPTAHVEQSSDENKAPESKEVDDMGTSQ